MSDSGSQTGPSTEPSPPAEQAELEHRGAVSILRLNRPAVHNVVSRDTISQLEGLLDALDQRPETRCLVLTGAGEKTFCAGSDLADLAPLAGEGVDPRERHAALDMSPRMSTILDRLDTGPRVTLAALNGSAYGGGCELMTACHLRVAAEGSRFSFRQAALGVSTGWGGGVRLFRLVGRSEALRLLLTAESVEVEEARRRGLVDFVVPRDQVLATTLDLAERIASNVAGSITAILELARAIDAGPLTTARAVERRLFAERWQDAPFWQNVAAWRDRRRD